MMRLSLSGREVMAPAKTEEGPLTSSRIPNDVASQSGCFMTINTLLVETDEGDGY